MATNQRERLLIISTLAVLAAFVGNLFIVEPLTAAWQGRNERIAKLQQDIAKGDALISRRQRIDEGWHEMLASGLPVERSQAESEVLDAVGEWTENSRIVITSVKRRWLENAKTPESKLEIRLTASGNIQQITRFLYALESAPKALLLEDVEIRARDERGNQLELDVLLTGLILPQEKKS